MYHPGRVGCAAYESVPHSTARPDNGEQQPWYAGCVKVTRLDACLIILDPYQASRPGDYLVQQEGGQPVPNLGWTTRRRALLFPRLSWWLAVWTVKGVCHGDTPI